MKCWCGAPAHDTLFRESVCSGSALHDPRATGEPSSTQRIYVAGPMTGYPDCNYPEFFRNAALLESAGFTAVNPANSNVRGHYVDFLREDLRELLDCDGVAILHGWWASVGARNEVQVAGLLKLPVHSVSEWLTFGPTG